jgi:alpha-ribazole phosphatase
LATELLLIRHAPSIPPGKLYGRTDVAADVTMGHDIAAIRQAAGSIGRWISSPALRCCQTLKAIWGDDARVNEDPRLWEQDFGEWEGLAHKDIPDMGERAADALAEHCPPGGESFVDVCHRVQPALLEAVAENDGARIAIVAHAGVVRAAIALSLKSPGLNPPGLALSFEVQPLSLTKLRVYSADMISIAFTNWRPQCV